MNRLILVRAEASLTFVVAVRFDVEELTERASIETVLF